MGKFKIGDKVVNKNNWNGKYEGYRIFKGYYTNCTGTYCTLSDLDILSVSVATGWADKDLELYIEEEIKMQKSFEEVIACGVEGQSWESNNNASNIKYIKFETWGINLILRNKLKNYDGDSNDFGVNKKTTFTLQRKKVSFVEAFRAREEGKVIESCVNGEKYDNREFATSDLFSTSQIKGQWYINN